MENHSTLSAGEVGYAFYREYYRQLHENPNMLNGYYEDPSEPNKDKKSVSNERGINKVISSLNVKDYNVMIRTVDSQFSQDNGLIVLINGSFVGDNHTKKFSQTFFLASRPSFQGRTIYVVLNDIFRFDDEDADCSPPTPAAAELTLVVGEAPAEENGHASENGIAESPVESVKTEVPLANGSTEESEAVAEENGHTPENGIAESPVESVKTEVPLANGSTEDVVPVVKKSFASVVSSLNLNPGPFQVRAPQSKPIEQHQAKTEQVAPTVVNGSVGKSTESAPAKSHGIFVPSLPMNATVDELDKVFKQFGPIKSGGIQVRSNKQQGTCFGFVEYESASSMQSALQASPIVFGPRKLFIKEKKATNDGPKFSSGNNRGGGYRNHNFSGGRGNFNGNNRGGYRRKEVSDRGLGNSNNAPRNGKATTSAATVKA